MPNKVLKFKKNFTDEEWNKGLQYIIDNYAKDLENWEYKYITEELSKLEDKTPFIVLLQLFQEENIPYELNEIPGETFYGSDLLEIEIPDQVKKIGEDAFFACRLLESITVPNNVEEIGNNAFYNCTLLQSINISNNVEKIGNGTFSWCEHLESLIIPNSVKEIGEDVFFGCKSLKSINIPNSVEKMSSGTFYNCYSLESITLPNSIKEIHPYTFYTCESLKSVNIPNSVEEIRHHAFFGCKSLELLTLPDNVEKIGGGAFYDCKSLKSMIIPNNVKKISHFAFAYCTSLQSIEISASVENMGESVFYNCPNLIIHTKNPYVIEYCKKNNLKYDADLKEEFKYEKPNESTGVLNTLTSYLKKLNYEIIVYKKNEKVDGMKMDISNYIAKKDDKFFNFAIDEENKIFKIKNIANYGVRDGELTKILKYCLSQLDSSWIIEIENNENESYWDFIKKEFPNLKFKNSEPDFDFNDDDILNEDVEIHNTLNPKLWKDNKLLPEVENKIKEIVKNFKKNLEENEIELKIDDIYILGSNANYNYNEDSDLDIHIIADESFDCSEEHLNIIYNAYKKIFNDTYDISLNGVNTEIYVENKDKLSNVATGVYSLKDGWIKKPEKYNVPDIDNEELNKKVKEWEEKYNTILEHPTTKKIEDYLNDIYEIRQNSLVKEGEFGLDNLCFKEIRRLGYLDDLKEIRNSLISKNLSLDEI